MHIYLNNIKKNWFLISCTVVLLISLFLRFYNYSGRWGLAYDQAHDAVLARYAVQHGKIPLLGPFSSAGPFQTGGEWYWLLMIPSFVYPYSVLSPWIFMTLLYVVFVAVIVKVAQELEGRIFALIVGVLTAFSTAQIAQSVSLTNQSPQALISLLALWSAIEYIKTQKSKYVFLLSFFASLGATIHLQGVANVILIVVTLLIVGKQCIKKIPILLAGGIIPFLPILLYDANHNFFNIRNMAQYYLYDQYKISLDVLGRRWLTYGGVFIPSSWGKVIGGYPVVAYTEMIGIIFVFAALTVRKMLSKSKYWVVIGVSTILMVCLLRYTRTPLFDSYLVFMHPYIILLSAFVVYKLLQVNRLLGLLLFLLILTGSIYRDILEIKGGTNYAALTSELLINGLYKKFPNQKYMIYDRNFGSRDKSVPIVLFLDEARRIDDSGHKIGVTIDSGKDHVLHPALFGNRGEYQLFDLTNISNEQLSKEKWVPVNPKYIYISTEEWYTKK